LSETVPSLTPLSRVRIAVDCMGGDHGPSVTLPACKAFLASHPEAELLLVGAAEALAPAAGWVRCTQVTATEVVAMDDPVDVALRRKKDSSMRVAISQLKSADEQSPALADVCVSAGNTGALMALARYLLKTVDGIDRPAIASVLPNEHGGFTTMLDLGANVDCTPEHLGSEVIKGSDVIKRAGDLLRAAAAGGHLNYHGNVEGNDIFEGTTDVVVCDGFVGNVALKTTEGLAHALSQFIREEFTRSWWTKLAALVALPVLKRFRARVDPRGYNGAALLGLRGLVFKSHGGADAYAFERALVRAHDAARNRLLDQVRGRIVDTLQSMPIQPADEFVRPAA
jgi:glycerol-3-phosphate acyltransferase PlsX